MAHLPVGDLILVVRLSWQLGDLDLSLHLSKFQDRDLLVILAPASLTTAGKVIYQCVSCGFVYAKPGECPRCQMYLEETEEGQCSKQEREALFRQVEQALSDSWDQGE